MIILQATHFNEVYTQLIATVMSKGESVAPKGIKTKELHPVMIEIDKPLHRVITGRPINLALSLAEVIWILSGQRDVNSLSYHNDQISKYSDNDIYFNAAYGYRLRSAFGVDQINQVVKTLKDDPDSRQATLVMSHPYDDRGWDAQTGEKHNTKDRACNVLSHLMIREGKLDWLQIVRSNDAMWGTPYNWMQFTYLQEYIATMIGIPVGKYFHVADSLHIYEWHWQEAESTTDTFDLYSKLGEHQPIDAWGLGTARSAAEGLRRVGASAINWDALGPQWASILRILCANHYYRQSNNAMAIRHLTYPNTDPIYSAAQARFYWVNRWHKMKEFITPLTARMTQRWGSEVTEWVTHNTYVSA